MKPTIFFPEPQYSNLGANDSLSLLCDPELPPRRFVLVNGLSRALNPRAITAAHLSAAAALVQLGMFAAATDQYRHCLNHAFRVRCASEDHVTAYRRLILANMLSSMSGLATSSKSRINAVKDRAALPRYFSHQTADFLTSRARSYISLCEAFFDTSPVAASTFRTIVEDCSDVWIGDRTDDLVKLVCVEFQRHQIRRLATVYAALPVSLVRSKTQSGVSGTSLGSDDETLAFLNTMISAAELDAIIINREQSDGSNVPYLRFTSRASSKSTLDKQMPRSRTIKDYAIDARDAIWTEPPVQIHTHSLGGGGGHGRSGRMWSSDWDSSARAVDFGRRKIEDEDLDEDLMEA